VSDHYAPDEESALAKVRDILSALPPGDNRGLMRRTVLPAWSKDHDEPLYPIEDLLKIVPEDNKIPFDIKEVICRILDGSRFHEFKSKFGTSIVCGFGTIMGLPIGIVGNNGILFSESALK